MSRLVLFFPNFPFYDVHLSKDVGQFPLYFRKNGFDSVSILKYGGPGSTLPGVFDGVYIENVKQNSSIYKSSFRQTPFFWFRALLDYARYTRKHRESITHVMMFHTSIFSLCMAVYLKKTIPSVKIYIKMDIELTVARRYDSGLSGVIKRHLIPYVDVLSAETRAAYNAISSIPYMANRLALLPNGLSEALLAAARDTRDTPKEKLIITVGRIGSHQKNTELFLSALGEQELGDWTVIIAGPRENGSFDAFLDSWLLDHPLLREKVVCTGSISDSAVLYDLYSRAAVFVFPSRHESFGIALMEAAAFGCYCISTDVGAARDVLDDGRFGYICGESSEGSQNEASIRKQIAAQLRGIIDGTIDYSSQNRAQRDFVSATFGMQAIIERNHPWFAK